MEDEVFDYMNENFPLPRVQQQWTIGAMTRLKNSQNLLPDREWDAFIEALGTLTLGASFATCAEPGSGLPPTLSLATMCTVINRPVVLELVHLSDIGASAFDLEKVRYNRDRSFRFKLHALANDNEVATPEKLSEIRGGLPSYPRKCLQLHLSDGTRKLVAVELEHLDVHLGKTPMGTKIELFGFPIVKGIALLRRANVNVLGGGVEAMEHPHQLRLAAKLYKRMQEELVLAKNTEIPFPDMFSEHGVEEV